MRRPVFENRAWKEAGHPRYVSEPLKVSEDKELVFEISYHYVEEKYYVETQETHIKADGFRETYASWRFFDSLDDCFDYTDKRPGHRLRRPLPIPLRCVRLGRACDILGEMITRYASDDLLYCSTL